MTAANDWKTPEWVRHAIFYQIFPDRWANGDPTNDPENVVPWGSQPTIINFMGGDLQGIIDHLDYLGDLGINAIYLNPIFQATSNHKYNTFDYLTIDPHFGTLDTFKQLIAAAHARNIRVILDGVFNHCGRGFYAFNDLLENGEASPYLHWFHPSHFPLNAYETDLPAGYTHWWVVRSLPKFNTDHRPVRDYLLHVARYWIEQGADGWRLDVPNEIADHTFWREFRAAVKGANPDAYIVGEIWKDGSPWLDGTQFDAVMNYLFRELMLDFFAKRELHVDQFAEKITHLTSLYHPEVTAVQFNLLSSHDTERFLYCADDHIERLKLATLFQMTYPGAPSIYYGDEIGKTSKGDPDCREAFPWDEQQWNTDLRTTFRRYIGLRNRYRVLRTGTFEILNSDPAHGLVAYLRDAADEFAVVVINNSDTDAHVSLDLASLHLPDGSVIQDLLDDRSYDVHGQTVHDLMVRHMTGIVLHGHHG